VRFAFIATEKARFPVTLLGQVLQVSRSGFYAWQQRPAAQRTRQNQRLGLEIAATSPRVAAAMAVRGCTPSCATAGIGPDANGSHG
jgi:putative transposase